MIGTRIDIEGIAVAGRAVLAEYGLAVELERSIERCAVDGCVRDVTGLNIESRFSVKLDESLKSEFGPALHAAADVVIGARMDALLEAHYASKAMR